jgi:hypothetical protein
MYRLWYIWKLFNASDPHTDICLTYSHTDVHCLHLVLQYHSDMLSLDHCQLQSSHNSIWSSIVRPSVQFYWQMYCIRCDNHFQWYFCCNLTNRCPTPRIVKVNNTLQEYRPVASTGTSSRYQGLPQRSSLPINSPGSKAACSRPGHQMFIVKLTWIMENYDIIGRQNMQQMDFSCIANNVVFKTVSICDILI